MTAYPNRYGEDAAMPETNRMQGTAQRQLVALTTDSALIRALQDLTSDGTAVFVLSDVRALSDELMQRTGAVALIDAGSLDAPIDGVVDAFSTQFPDLKLLVAGHTPDQNALTRRIASQAVFRFVHKPVSPQRLKLFLDAAARPDTQRGQLAPAETSFAEPSSLRRLDTAVQGRSPLMLATIGVAVIAAIAAAAWVFWLKDSKPAAVVAASARTCGAGHREFAGRAGADPQGRSRLRRCTLCRARWQQRGRVLSRGAEGPAGQCRGAQWLRSFGRVRHPPRRRGAGGRKDSTRRRRRQRHCVRSRRTIHVWHS